MEKKKHNKFYVFLMVLVFFIALGFLFAISSLLYSTALNLNVLHDEMEMIVRNTVEINKSLKTTNENILGLQEDMKQISDGINGLAHPLNSMKLNLDQLNPAIGTINSNINEIIKDTEKMDKNLEGVYSELHNSWVM